MNRNLIIFLLSIAQIMVAQDTKFISNFTKTIPKSTELCLFELFELSNLQAEIEQNPSLFQNQWTNNAYVKNVIENIEFTIKASPKNMRDALRNETIRIFQKYGINIIFTPEHYILRRRPIPNQANGTNDSSDKESHMTTHVHIPVKKKSSPPSSDLKRTKGARKTLRALEEARKRRQEAQEVVDAKKNYRLESNRLEKELSASRYEEEHQRRTDPTEPENPEPIED